MLVDNIKMEEADKPHSPTTPEGYSTDKESMMMIEMDTENLENCGMLPKHGAELKRPDLKGQFRCSICEKVFCHSSSLSRHRMQAHFKSYKCTVCRKDISSSESLRTHMFKQHHISRMYMCRCCNWAFPDKSLLHIHLSSAMNNNNLEIAPHSVINRSCHLMQDSFQLIRSPLMSLPSHNGPLPALPIGTVPIPETPDFTKLELPTWMVGLPKPIPTTTPIFPMDATVKTPQEDLEPKPEAFVFPQSPTHSIKSEGSAFHEVSLNTSDQGLITSPLGTNSSSPSSSSSSSSSSSRSPIQDCYECETHKTRTISAELHCHFMENLIAKMRQDALEANAQMNGLEQTVLRLRMEAHVLREHNEMFQRKLLDIQNMAVNFLQSEKCSENKKPEVNTFLHHLINTTILTSSPK